jgi:hypothetical protein
MRRIRRCNCPNCRGTTQFETPSRSGAQGERSALLLHGTTRGVANKIRSSQAMPQQTTYFALGWANRDLARIFAMRAASRRPMDGGPALVLVTVPEEALARLRSQRLIKALPFDPGDQPALRKRMQWVVEPGGMDLLNRAANQFGAVPMK